MPSGVCSLVSYARPDASWNSKAYLVGFDMCTEPRTQRFGVLVHLGAVARKNRAVDDECGRPERIEVLALVLIDEILFLGLATDVVGGARLLWNERVRLGVFFRTHCGRRWWQRCAMVEGLTEELKRSRRAPEQQRPTRTPQQDMHPVMKLSNPIDLDRSARGKSLG